jgi:MoaA/NifB/PqqE/SkfB family radical SAM enzyme
MATKGHPYVELAHRMASCNWNFCRAFMVNLILRRMVFGVTKTMDDHDRESGLMRQEIFWPSVIAISVNTDCNLKCAKCYAVDRFDDHELPISTIDRIITEGESRGTFMYDIPGGEPMLRSDEIFGVIERHPKSCFVVFTNGTLIDASVAHRAAQLGNVVFIISLDGFEKTNDSRRGDGVFNKVMQAMDYLAAEGVAFGASVMVSRQNYDEVVSDRFLQLLVSKRSLHVAYIKYVPTDGQPDPEWDLTDDQEVTLGIWAEYARDHYPLYVRVGDVANSTVQQCDAARRHIHIGPDGAIEPCLFCPVSVDNIHDTTVLAGMNSPFFERIRQLNSINETGCSALKPCTMYRDPTVKDQVIALTWKG